MIVFTFCDGYTKIRIILYYFNIKTTRKKWLNYICFAQRFCAQNCGKYLISAHHIDGKYIYIYDATTFNTTVANCKKQFMSGKVQQIIIVFSLIEFRFTAKELRHLLFLEMNQFTFEIHSFGMIIFLLIMFEIDNNEKNSDECTTDITIEKKNMQKHGKKDGRNGRGQSQILSLVRPERVVCVS